MELPAAPATLATFVEIQNGGVWESLTPSWESSNAFQVQINVLNLCADVLHMCWIDSTGMPQQFSQIHPAGQNTTNTVPGHVFLLGHQTDTSKFEPTASIRPVAARASGRSFSIEYNVEHECVFQPDPELLQDALLVAIGELAESNGRCDIEALLAYHKNAVANPGEAKFRRIPGSNKRLNMGVLTNGAARRLLGLTGWSVEAASGDVVLEHENPTLLNATVLHLQTLVSWMRGDRPMLEDGLPWVTSLQRSSDSELGIGRARWGGGSGIGNQTWGSPQHKPAPPPPPVGSNASDRLSGRR